MSSQLQAIELAPDISATWVADAAAKLDAATRAGPDALKGVLSAETCCRLLDRCQKLLHGEPTLLQVGVRFEAALPPLAFDAAAVAAAFTHDSPLASPQVTPPEEGQVVVVGDTHGQFHDVCRM